MSEPDYEDLHGRSLKDLREIAKRLKLRRTTGLKKGDLIQRIRESLKGSADLFEDLDSKSTPADPTRGADAPEHNTPEHNASRGSAYT